MTTTTKKSRKAIHNYTFGQTTINLNGYSAICTVTGNSKSFYHSYLANLIETKYDNDFSKFEATYVSREGLSVGAEARKIGSIEDRISNLYNKIKELKSKRDELVEVSVA